MAQPLRVEVEREADGRFLAAVRDLPGVIAYGDTQYDAARKVVSTALELRADMVESGEELPATLKTSFPA